jgi:hypothetical protein
MTCQVIQTRSDANESASRSKAFLVYLDFTVAHGDNDTKLILINAALVLREVGSTPFTCSTDNQGLAA